MQELATLFGHYLHALVTACDHFDQAQIHVQVGACFLSFGHSMQVDISWSQYHFHWYEHALKAALE